MLYLLYISTDIEAANCVVMKISKNLLLLRSEVSYNE
jgi:hypothetical protein